MKKHENEELIYDAEDAKKIIENLDKSSDPDALKDASVTITRGELMRKYPKIFRQKDLPMTETCMCWGLEVDEGWLWLIDDLCAKLQFNTDVNGFPQVEALQVKEKFGTLCFYHTTVDNGSERNEKFLERNRGFIEGMIDTYESMSGKVCEICGERGALCRRGGWYKTLCPKHATENEYKLCKKEYSE